MNITTQFNKKTISIFFGIYITGVFFSVSPIIVFISIIYIIYIWNSFSYRIKYPNACKEIIQLSISSTINNVTVIYYLFVLIFMIIIVSISIGSMISIDLSGIVDFLSHFFSVFTIKEVECSQQHFSLTYHGNVGMPLVITPTNITDILSLGVNSNLDVASYSDGLSEIGSDEDNITVIAGSITNSNDSNHNSNNSEESAVSAESIILNNAVIIRNENLVMSTLQDTIQNSNVIFSSANMDALATERQYNLLSAFTDNPYRLDEGESYNYARSSTLFVLNKAETILEQRDKLNLYNRLLFDINLFNKYGNITPVEIAYQGLQEGSVDMLVDSRVKYAVMEELKYENSVSIFARMYSLTLELATKRSSTGNIPNINTNVGLLENSPVSVTNFLPRIINLPLYFTGNFITNFNLTSVISTLGTMTAATQFLLTGDEDHLEDLNYSYGNTLAICGPEQMKVPETFKDVFSNYLQFALNNPTKVLSFLSVAVFPYLDYGFIMQYVVSPVFYTTYYTTSIIFNSLFTGVTSVFNMIPSYDIIGGSDPVNVITPTGPIIPFANDVATSVTANIPNDT